MGKKATRNVLGGVSLAIGTIVLKNKLNNSKQILMNNNKSNRNDFKQFKEFRGKPCSEMGMKEITNRNICEKYVNTEGVYPRKLKNGPTFWRSGCSRGALKSGYWWVEGTDYKKNLGHLRNGWSVCMP